MNADPRQSDPVRPWDLAVERVDGRLGHTVEFSNQPSAHRALYQEEFERLLDGAIFETPSGRRWRCNPGMRHRGGWYLSPLGPGRRGGASGGVVGKYVDPMRLEGYDRVWRVVSVNSRTSDEESR